VSEAEGRAVSRCRDCEHVQELCYSWCMLCGCVRLEIVVLTGPSSDSRSHP
jgi:hypothetical protein